MPMTWGDFGRAVLKTVASGDLSRQNLQAQGAAARAEREVEESRLRRDQAFFSAVEYDLPEIMKRAKVQYANGVRQERGTIQGLPALLEYGQTGQPSRIDIFYAAQGVPNPKDRNIPHGHIVVKDGVVDYARQLSDSRSDPTIDGRRRRS